MTLLRFSMASLFSMLVLMKLVGALAVGVYEWLAVLAMVAEAGIASAFYLGRVRHGAIAGTVLFLGAFVLALTWTGGECACLGGWVDLRERSVRAMVAALGGLLCSATWCVSTLSDSSSRVPSSAS